MKRKGVDSNKKISSPLAPVKYESNSTSVYFKQISRIDILGTFCMMTSLNGNIFRVTGPLCGEFTSPGEFPLQRPAAQSFDVFFDLSLNKRLNKQPWGWWFETLLWSLWCQCNVCNWSQAAQGV